MSKEKNRLRDEIVAAHWKIVEQQNADREEAGMFLFSAIKYFIFFIIIYSVAVWLHSKIV